MSERVSCGCRWRDWFGSAEPINGAEIADSRDHIAEPRQTWLAYAALGRFHAERKDGHAARRAYHAARQTIEQVKSDVRDRQLRAGFEHSPAIREIYERSGPEP